MNKGSINTDYKIVINRFLMLMPHAIYCSNYGVNLSALCLVWIGAKYLGGNYSMSKSQDEIIRDRARIEWSASVPG
jgi:hypothetical protein